MSKGEILDLLYESDQKTFYSDLLCLQKSGSYYKTEKIFSGTPQMLFFDEFGTQIGEALEFNDKAYFYDADHKLLFTVELYVGYFDRVELIFRNAEGDQIRSKKLPYTYKTRKMLEEEKAEREKKERKKKEEEEKRRREEKNRGTPPADGREGIGDGSETDRKGGVPDINPWPYIIVCVLLCLPLTLLFDRIVTNNPYWYVTAYQVRVFMLKFSELWVYPTLAALFILTVRFPRKAGFGAGFLWVLMLAGLLTAQFYLSRQLGRMLHPLGMGVVGMDNVKIVLLCFLPSLAMLFGAAAVADILTKAKKSSAAIRSILARTAKLNQIFSGLLMFVCRMSAAWEFQMTAYTVPQMAFRTVWYAVLIFFVYWIMSMSKIE